MTRKRFNIIIELNLCIGVRQIMKQIVDTLREQEYVSAANVEALRKYIRVKNPESSPQELSAVFADALRKIIDTRICQFEEKHRKKIKDDVLRKAVKKKKFSINAAEVFSTCLSLKLHEDSYIDSFTQWINQNQPVPVSAEKVDRLISRVGLLDEDYIENNLDGIIYEFEDSWAEDESLTVLGLEIDEASMPQAFEEVAFSAGSKNIKLEDKAEAEWIETVRELIDIPAPEFEGSAPKPGEAAACQPVDGIKTAEAPVSNFAELCDMLSTLSASALNKLKYVRHSVKPAMLAALPLVVAAAFVFANLLSDNRVQALQHPGQGRYANIADEQVDRYLSLESKVHKKLGFGGAKDLILQDGLQRELRYVEVDGKKLKSWLEKKNSLLAEEPYFTAILDTSRQYDIHPLLMFAIVGQEQAFVPKSYASAKKIANNPFNVYGSWEKYNTDIYDSSRLAADTIIKSSSNRPVYMNAIRWINRRYAEDPNWWNGVSRLFNQMKKDIVL